MTSGIAEQEVSCFQMRRPGFFAALLLAAIACTDAASERQDSPGPTPDGGRVDATPSGEAGTDEGDAASSMFDVTNETISVGSQSRSYVLVVPKPHDATRAYPLVLAFHGDGGDGPSFQRAFAFERASGDRAIVAYPSGLDRTWDHLSPAEENVDFAFVDALIGALVTRVHVDPTRVFGAGWSNGGFFVNQFACSRSGVFRAISSQSGGAPYEGEGALEWKPGYPKCTDDQTGIASIHVHGTIDGTVTIDSGDFAAMYWAYVNGCDEAREPTTPSPCLLHQGCPSGKPVVFCPVDGMGHAIWSQAAQVSWDFFEHL